VLHDFAVAQFRVKMDLVPGTNTFLWLTPTKTGRFEILCEELCGIGHHTMRGAVIVDDADNYKTWLANQPTYDELNNKHAGNASIGAAQYAVCAACHGQQGEGVQAMNSPKIAGQSEWYLKRQIMNYKKGLRGTHEDDVFGAQMIGMVATLADEQAIDNVVAHIRTFPDNAPAATVTGDVVRGKKHYNVCAYCHGKDGMGVQAMNAPRAAGMSDWYMARQLQNFKDDVRGGHPQDYYGKQMGYMGDILHDQDAINDVIAYINTL
jgi:cytochrome c oxidase subunit 2